jgi:hypothetical protein
MCRSHIVGVDTDTVASRHRMFSSSTRVIDFHWSLKSWGHKLNVERRYSGPIQLAHIVAVDAKTWGISRRTSSRVVNWDVISGCLRPAETVRINKEYNVYQFGDRQPALFFYSMSLIVKDSLSGDSTLDCNGNQIAVCVRKQ